VRHAEPDRVRRRDPVVAPDAERREVEEQSPQSLEARALASAGDVYVGTAHDLVLRELTEIHVARVLALGKTAAQERRRRVGCGLMGGGRVLAHIPLRISAIVEHAE
jgi:hypothetical protein